MVVYWDIENPGCRVVIAFNIETLHVRSFYEPDNGGICGFAKKSMYVGLWVIFSESLGFSDGWVLLVFLENPVSRRLDFLWSDPTLCLDECMFGQVIA